MLDVGCGKGFMLHDMAELIPGLTVRGIDISEYAIEHAIEDMRPFVEVANATDLPFEDNSFDVVISINTVHNTSAGNAPGHCRKSSAWHAAKAS